MLLLLYKETEVGLKTRSHVPQNISGSNTRSGYEQVILVFNTLYVGVMTNDKLIHALAEYKYTQCH